MSLCSRDVPQKPVSVTLDEDVAIGRFIFRTGTTIYGATAKPSEKGYETINDSPDAATLSWEISTTPVDVPGFKPTASVVIDSTKTDTAKLKELEDILYGTADGVNRSSPNKKKR